MSAGSQDTQAAATALEQLCRAYWYPLYAYARRQGHNPDDGQDLTQQFFAGFLEKNYFRMADPERGRFRCFLLSSFKHFLANEHHRSRAAKRGGQYAFVSWDEADAEGHYRNEPATDTSPDRLFEHAWTLTLLDKVMNELRQEYVSRGQTKLFETLHIFLPGEKSELTYEEIGRSLSMSESAVKMAVLRLRQRYGQMLRLEVAHTVLDPNAVEEELRHLLGVLSR